MRKVYLIGTGQTKRGFHPHKDWRRLVFEAAMQALEDASIDLTDIKHIWLAHFPATADLHFTASHAVVDMFGLSGRAACTCVEKACTSSGDAMHAAFMSIASGMYDYTLVTAVGKVADSLSGGFSALAESNLLLAQQGILDGLDRAREGGGEDYLRNYVTQDDIYALYSTWYWYAVRHPNSMVYKQSYKTKDEWYKMPFDTYPFRAGTGGCRFADGASAAVLCSEEIAKKHKGIPVEIVASVSRDEAWFQIDRVQYHPAVDGVVPMVRWSWEEAYKMAKAGPTDFDVLQLHDNSPMKSWKHVEMFNHPDIAVPGGGPKWYTDGQALPGGKLPMVTGGQCKGGYIMACVAIDQIIENVLQLTERAGERQVPLKKYIAASVDSTIRTYISILRR